MELRPAGKSVRLKADGGKLAQPDRVPKKTWIRTYAEPLHAKAGVPVICEEIALSGPTNYQDEGGLHGLARLKHSQSLAEADAQRLVNCLGLTWRRGAILHIKHSGCTIKMCRTRKLFRSENKPKFSSKNLSVHTGYISIKSLKISTSFGQKKKRFYTLTWRQARTTKEWAQSFHQSCVCEKRSLQPVLHHQPSLIRNYRLRDSQ